MLDDLQLNLFRLFRTCRGTWHRLCWIARHNMFFWDKAVLFVAWAFTANWTLGSVFHADIPSAVKYITLAIAISGGISYYLHHFSLRPNGKIADLAVKGTGSEVIWTNAGQSILTDPQVNLQLEGGANPIRYHKKPGSVDPMVNQFLVQFIFKMKNGAADAGWDTFDDPKLGLKTDIRLDLLNNVDHVDIQRTSYFRDRLSNGLTHWSVYIKDRLAFDFIEEAFDLVREVPHGNYWRMKDLANSSLANQLGASTVLITANGYAVYLTQGGRSAENANKLAPSGSGSFDAGAIGRLSKQTLQALVRIEAKRELCEECGLTDADIVDIQICGFGRYIYRGGKPEFFCVATTTRSYGDISIPFRELNWQQKTKAGRCLNELNRDSLATLASSAAAGLDLHADEIESNHRHKPVSGPLLWNLRMAAAYLRGGEEPARTRLLSALLARSTRVNEQ